MRSEPKRERTADFYVEGQVTLSESEIWPDNDAPENWTEKDVLAVIVRCGGNRNVIRDWDLDDDLRLSVWCNPVPKSSPADA